MPHYAKMIVAARHITLQPCSVMWQLMQIFTQVVAEHHMNNQHCSSMPHAATTL
jgi:hypothetical protein